VQDKTGSGQRGTSNDIAVITPPEKSPIYVTAYLTGANVEASVRDAILAEVGRLVVETFGR
jgi:beta-lactamase class A